MLKMQTDTNRGKTLLIMPEQLGWLLRGFLSVLHGCRLLGLGLIDS